MELKNKVCKEYSNFYVIPRASDGKCINGAYNRIGKKNGKLPTLPSSNVPFIEIRKHNDIIYYRKLTTKEYFINMGGSEEQYNKVKDLPKSSLYYTAGNSMIIPVMEEVIREVLRSGKGN